MEYVILTLYLMMLYLTNQIYGSFSSVLVYVLVIKGEWICFQAMVGDLGHMHEKWICLSYLFLVEHRIIL